jgi:hypothetical protein
MNQDTLEQVAKMLRSQMKGAGHLWWIGGFVYGQTSNGDVFVILYPAADHLKEKVVRVYDRDLKKLPAFIPVDGVDAGDTEANPSKEQARRKGIYHECPAFEICTFDGKDTQMGKERRFGEVLRLSKAAREALGGQAGQRPAAPAQTQQQWPAQGQALQRPPQPPLDEARPAPAVEKLSLPDYQALALAAKTEPEFDYAAYMVLRNGLYTAVSRITAVRQAIVIGWKPGERSNAAMLNALQVYRDKRAEAEGRGEDEKAAKQFARHEAMSAYNEAIKGGGK